MYPQLEVLDFHVQKQMPLSEQPDVKNIPVFTFASSFVTVSCF